MLKTVPCTTFSFSTYLLIDTYVASVCAYVSHSVVSDSVTPWTVAHQAPLATGVSRQEYCSGLPFPSPGDLPDPRIELWSPTSQEVCLQAEPPFGQL